MDAVIRPLRGADEPAAARLLNDTVGPGFRDLDRADWTFSFVAMTEEGVAGLHPRPLAPVADLPVAARAFAKRLPARTQGRLQRSPVSGDQVRRLPAHSGSSRQTKVSFCRSRSAICNSSRVFMTKGP